MRNPRKLLALSLLMLAGTALAADPLADAVPFRRVDLAADQVAAQQERVRQGQLAQLPRAPFEALVRQANAAGKPPHLVETRYRARLVETALEGTAQWNIVNPSQAAAVLPIQPLGIAVRQARWRKGGDAILGNLVAGLGLLVTPEPQATLELDWSARSNPVTGGLRFTLDVPACAIGFLELELPSDRAVSVSRDAFHLSGPLPTAMANHRLWRLGFSGRTQVSFIVRKITGPGLPAPLVLVRQQSKQVVTPGELLADFDLELEVLHLGATKLVCDCDPGLRPYQVNIRNLESWALKAGKTPTSPSQLQVRLREPLQGGVLQVKCLASVTADAVWSAPTIRLNDAVVREETLVLHIDPEIQLENWQPGSYRLTQASVAPDGQQVLTLSAGIEAGPAPTRPKAKLATPGPEFAVRQYSWWELAADRQTLTSRMALDVTRGRLFRLPVQLPIGWVVEQVDMVPPARLGQWTVIAEKAKPLLMVDLQRALAAPSSARLTVRLRRDPALGGLAFPDVIPLGARQREGALGLTLAASYVATATANVPSVVGGVDDQDPLRPPWGKQPLDYFYPFQGRAVEGILKLRGRDSQVRAVCAQDLVIAANQARLATRLDLFPEAGAPRHIDLYISGHHPGPWPWHSLRGGNQVERMERLPAFQTATPLAALAARDVWQAAAMMSLPRPAGDWWRLTLARPLTEPLSLEARQPLASRASSLGMMAKLVMLASQGPLEAVGLRPVLALQAESQEERQVWDVPLVCVIAAERMEGTVTLQLAGADLVRVEATGLREVAAGRPARGQSAMPWRTYRYSQLPVALTLHGSAVAADRVRQAVIDAAALTSQLEPTGRLVHHFRFRVRDWRQRTIPVRLPAAAQLLSARGEGNWLHHLPPAKAAGAMVEYELPVTGGGEPMTFDLHYADAATSFTLWQRLQAPAPELPVEPITFERTWQMPPGVVPLLESGWQRLPGAGKHRRWLPTFRLDDGTLDWQPQQEQVITEAILAIRQAHGDNWTLGDVLDRIAIDHLKDRLTLIIDTEALCDLGLETSTPLPATAWDGGKPWSPASFPLPVPWESVGLVYVPFRSAALLTSRANQLSWQEGSVELTSGSIDQAVAAAARHGQDQTGRFHRVVEWLDRPTRAALPGADDPLMNGGLAEGWTAWEPLPGSAQPATLLVIRPAPVPLAGVLLGVALAFAAIRIGPQPGRRRFRLFLIWLAIGGLGLVWLPDVLRPLAWGPALVGMAVGLLWCVRLALRLRRATAAAAAVLLGFLLYSQSLAAPELPIVYLLPETEDAPAQVLAPPDLLARLRQFDPAALDGARLLAADYHGQVESGRVVFTARYRVHGFAAEPAALLLPLTGVQLIDATLDDRPAQPVAQAAGYSVRVPSGDHTLVLRFSVPLPAQDEDRDLRFSIPEVIQNRLVLEAPSTASHLHVVEARGGQRATADAKMVRLEADLGPVAAVRVRWRQEDAPEKAGGIRVREGYYWELKGMSARLLAVLHYSVNQGWFTKVTVELPRDLEVVSVEAGPPPGAGVAAPRLKDWSLFGDGNKRRLDIEFLGPVTSSVLVTLELVPRQPLTRSTNLPFPTPVNGQPGRGFLAYRLEDVEAAGQEKALAITGMRKEEQEAAFNDWFAIPWAFARQEMVPPPSRFFWRMRGGELQLALQSPALPIACVQDVNWRVDPRQTTLRATATLTTTEPRLANIQWEVPAAFQVGDVSGPQLAHWTRSGNRIQAWLRKPTDKATLQLTGWLARPPKAPPRFDVPPLRVLDVAEEQTTLRISAAEGIALTPAKLTNLVPRAELDVPGKEWNFTATQANYGGSFTISPASGNAYFHLLTFAEVRDRMLVFDGTIECTVHRGELRRLTLSLRNWEGGDVQVTAGVGQIEERKAGGGARVWVVDLPQGVTRYFSLKLRGQIALENITDARMPDLRMESADDGPAAQERWLGVAGADLEALGASGLEAATDPSAALRSWPREADRIRRTGGAAWKVTGDDWRLRLAPRGPALSSIQLFLVEYDAAAANQRWLHRATYWLAHEGGADLALTLRDGARILGVRVNGLPVPPLVQPDGQRLWLPLVGGVGVQAVEVLWTYADGLETIDQPILEPPRLAGVSASPTVWTIQAPAGYQLQPTDANESIHLSSAASLDLSRADATLRLLNWLADRSSDPVLGRAHAAARQSFDRHLRFADYRLALSEDGAGLAAWLQELRQRRAELGPPSAMRPADVQEAPPAEPTAWNFALPSFAEGRPTYWYGPTDAGVPSFRLVSDASGRLRGLALATVLLFALLFASWILASLFGAAAWPEQLALLGALGWLVFSGVGGLFLILPACWLLIRFCHFLRLAWRLAPGRSAVEPPAA